MDPKFHGPCCAQLDGLKLPFGRQLDLWPRGHLKTHIITIAKNIQYYLQNNNVRIMLAGSSRENSMKNLRKIKHIFETNTLLHWLFPECIPDIKGNKWAEMEILLPRTRNHPESTFKCIGVGGHITGWHFDVLSKDDLIDEKTERSPEVMEKIIDWHLLTKNLLESPVTGIDQLVGTRWAMFDLYQHIITNEREYTVNKISALDLITGEPVWPSRFPKEALLDLRLKDPYMYACSRGDQPILMADWTEKPISKICVRESILGWAKVAGRQTLIPSTVLDVGYKVAPMFEITTEHGRKTYQTLDHRWWQTKLAWTGHDYPYAEVAPGDSLTSCYTPMASTAGLDLSLASWLGGMFDGEGTISGRDTLSICQSMRTNKPLCEKIANALDSLGIATELWLDERRMVAHFKISGRSNKLRFRALCNPYKLRGKQLFGTRLSEDFGQHCITSMLEMAPEQAFWLRTTTGNYVVSGFLSANCQQMNNPRDEAVTDFRASWLRYYGFADESLNILAEIG